MPSPSDVQGLTLPERFAPMTDRERYAIARAALASIVAEVRTCADGEALDPAWIARVGRDALEQAGFPPNKRD